MVMDKETVLDFLAALEVEQSKLSDIDKRFWLNVSYLTRKALSKGAQTSM